MFFRGKYLNSFDYTASFLDWQCRDTPGGGYAFCVLLETDGNFSEETLLEEMEGLLPSLRGVFGKRKRHPLTLAPYRSRGKTRTIGIGRCSIKEFGSVDRAAEDFSNQRLPSGIPIAVRLIADDSGRCRYLLWKFSHQLFDGTGAERFLDLLSTGGSGGSADWLDSPHLNDWRNQFVSGDTLRKEVFAAGLTRRTMTPYGSRHDANRFESIYWNEEETGRIMERAEREAGPYMQIPFFAGTAALLLRKILIRKGLRGDIVIPMSVDQRGQEDQASEATLGNHWSILPLILPEETPDSREAVIAALRNSFFASSAKRLAQAFRHAGFLTRIAPFFIMDRIAKKFSARTNGTFMFSLLSESMIYGKSLGGGKICDVIHYPSMPPAPGLGIIVTHCGRSLHLVVSSRTGTLTEAERLELKKQLEQELRGER